MTCINRDNSRLFVTTAQQTRKKRKETLLAVNKINMGILIVALTLLAVARAELVITVTPEVVNPGLTPSFAVNCALIEMEEFKIVTLTISRQTIRKDGTLRPKKEVIAKIDAMTPQAPLPSLKYPRVTVLGAITSIESELGSYLTAVWPNPRLEDLGLYTCDATVVGEFGVLEPLTAALQITSANPVVDRVLVALLALEAKLDGFNQTLVSFQTQLDNVTAEAQLREAALLEQLATTAAPTTAETTAAPTTVTDETTTTAGSTPAGPTAETTTTAAPTASIIDQLIIALEIITVRLETVNTTVTALEDKVTAFEAVNVTVSSLQEKVTAFEAVNETVVALEEKLVAFEAVNASVIIIEEKLIALETVNTSVTALEEKVTALESINASVEILEDKMAALESPVVENITEVTEQLAAKVAILIARLEAFNATVVALEQQVVQLVADELENDTITETKPADDLRRYFVSANSSYFLIRGREDTDSFKAQAVCESKQLYLAEINDQEELNFVEIEVGPYVLDDWPVLIGGKRRLGATEWTWQYSGNVVNYFSWAVGEPVLASINSDCIALRTLAGLAEMVSVPCYTEKRQFYFLCEKELK